MSPRSRSGMMITNLSGDAQYRSFRPSALPPDPFLEISVELLDLLVDTHRVLAKLDTTSKYIPYADLIIAMYVRKEALISSQIEGTQCTLDDVLDPQNESNMNLDVSEVIHYVKALQFSIDRMKELPLCNRLIKEIHAVLMENARGQDKAPGEFRTTQNWIGSAGSTLKTARFVPPNVSDMNQAMNDLETYINLNPEYDALIQSALIHYQFETIHPFLDGNGRLGRLIVLLYLIDHDILTKPVLYVSYFLKKNQFEYYDRMNKVRQSGDHEQWVLFFLEALRAAATDALSSIEALSALHEKHLTLLSTSTKKSEHPKALLNHMMSHPILDIASAAKALSVSYNTLSESMNILMSLGIVNERTNAKRNRIFVYEPFLAILRKDT